MRKVHLILLMLAVLSCRKNQTLLPEDNEVPTDILEKAKSWRSDHLIAASVPSTVSGGTKKNAKVKLLNPLWGDSRLESRGNAEKIVFVPAKEFKLGNKQLAVLRGFVFSERGGSIHDGKIIEVYGTPEYLSENRNIISKYHNDKIKGFEGSILLYDINYRFISGEIYQKGKKMNAKAWVQFYLREYP